MEAQSLSESQKSKSMYDKLASDILDIADSLTTVIAELQPHK